ncbi:MAG TPA: amino acid racemase [Terriglobales bacterium]|jgi:aspartate racemase|nr:amino acid racemase [Terriglobales bacterium]
MAEHQKTLHIGIVACSIPGAALCYQTIGIEGAQLLGEWNHPEISLHNLPMSEHLALLEHGSWQQVADLMLDSAHKLARIGADFLICPDNTLHQAFPYLLPRSPLPWLHIAEEVASEAKRRGFRRVGLTGTRWLVEGPVYAEKFSAAGVELKLPPPDARAGINRIIFEELVYGKLLPQSLKYFQQLITDLKAQGCDAVALSCTEIPLLVNDSNSPLPTLDSTRLLARAALRRAVSGLQASVAS